LEGRVQLSKNITRWVIPQFEILPY
jgi:hypothetical protein